MFFSIETMFTIGYGPAGNNIYFANNPEGCPEVGSHLRSIAAWGCRQMCAVSLSHTQPHCCRIRCLS